MDTMNADDGLVSLTLPIELRDGVFLDPEAVRRLGERWAQSYCSAKPFPHIVIDDFLPHDVVERLLADFPVDRSHTDILHGSNELGRLKRQVLPDYCGAVSKQMFALFNGRAFVQFLEGLTGIDGLVPDPYFEGGGYHETCRDGFLGIHADFRIHEKLHLQRRLNVLIYLNRDWEPAWGGNLELWDRGMKASARSIEPVLNRCVIFSTDATSYHGHPDPLACPPSRSRRSIALYYYTASRAIHDEVPNFTTMNRARPGDGPSTRSAIHRHRFRQYLHDILPPLAFRLYRRLRAAFRARP